MGCLVVFVYHEISTEKCIQLMFQIITTGSSKADQYTTQTSKVCSMVDETRVHRARIILKRKVHFSSYLLKILHNTSKVFSSQYFVALIVIHNTPKVPHNTLKVLLAPLLSSPKKPFLAEICKQVA
jgi:hypothetical protein